MRISNRSISSLTKCMFARGFLTSRGYNIGTRLVEDFLAKSNLSRCTNIREAAEVVSKVGFKMFLDITPNVIFPDSTVNTNSGSMNSSELVMNGTTAQHSKNGANTASGTVGTRDPKEFVLQLMENPLAEFVELPDEALQGGLWYSNVLAGVLRGALEMLQIQTECTFISDSLRGDETTEIRIRVLRFLQEKAPPSDD